MFDRRKFIGATLAGAGTALALPRLARAEGALTEDVIPGPPATIPDLIAQLPKVETHLHLEGTLEPEMKFALAERNGIKLPYRNVEEMLGSYRFTNLPEFLAVYYDGMQVLHTEEDYHDLCYAYLKKAASQNVLYAELFFDPQQHTLRGVRMEEIMAGFASARRQAQRDFGIDAQFILCFNRELTQRSAMVALEQGLPYRDQIVAIGLDSDERNNPPSKFAVHFDRARKAGLKITAHCDLNQKDTLEHIREAIQDIRVDRIDHGGNVLESPELIAMAKAANMYFAVCPVLSGTVRRGDTAINVARGMIDAGLNIYFNSDDPAYMKGVYLNEVYALTAAKSAMTDQEIVNVARNGFEAIWVEPGRKAKFLETIDAFAVSRGLEPGGFGQRGAVA